MRFAVAGALLTLMTAAPGDIKGKWDGKVTAQQEGGLNADPVLLILDQKDTTVTGTVGTNESDQQPVSGTVEGNKVSLAGKSANGREYTIELTIENDELKGTVSSGARQGQLHARRRK